MAKKKTGAKGHKGGTKAKSYDHMMGTPMDAAQHPATDLPAPQGGAMQGMGLSNLMPGGVPPSFSDYGV